MERATTGRNEELAQGSIAVAARLSADERVQCADREDDLIDLVMRWETAYLHGENLTPDPICPDDRALAKLLGERIAQRQKLYELIGLHQPRVHSATDCDRLPTIPGHEVLRELGRGGMGVVYLARDQKLGRVVAIKTITEARLATPDQVNRFLLEARAVARLRHPNIIAIHAIGEDPRRPYLSLEYVDGFSLAQRLADGPIGPLDAAPLLESLARAVQAVHELGIIHRDLKPSNVLLTADGVPKIADFGLAKLRDGEAGRTLTEQALGTPSFMAPEQAEGHSRDAGPAADVYALGAILYQALTGRPPFLGESAMETLNLVTSTEPVPPRRHRPGVPRDLETICLHCLEKEPARRYPSATALADDLCRFREGLSIAVHPVGPAGRTLRWGRRNKMLAMTAAALTLTFVMGTPALLGLWLRARADEVLAMAERNHARVERDRAERSRDRAIGAVQVLLETESDEMLSEEMRPYRKRMIDAGLRESLALVRELDGDPRAELEVIRAYAGLAQLQYEAGEPADGLISLRKAITLAERLAARDPGSVRSRGVVATVLHRAASLLSDPNERRANIHRSTEILQTLLAGTQGGDRRTWLKLVAMNHYNDGHALCGLGRLPEAVVAFRAARVTYDGLFKEGARQPRDLVLAGKNLLFLCRALGEHFDESVEAGRQALLIFQNLVAEHADSFDFAAQLYLTQSEIGLKAIAASQWDLAISSMASARGTLKEQASRSEKVVSRMATIQRLLAEADYNLRFAYESDPVRFAGPLRQLSREMFEICEKLSLVQPLPWNNRIAHAQSCLSEAGYQQDDGLALDVDLLQKAERLWDGIHGQAPGDLDTRRSLVMVRRKIAEAFKTRGRDLEAARWRKLSLDTARGYPALFYELAIGYATGAGLVGRVPTRLDVRQLNARRADLISESVAMLRESVADGFRDVLRLRSESAFESLRKAPEFRAVVSDAEFPVNPFGQSFTGR